ncbi:hypothetical protein B0T20DRAFT_461003 [Sordaria brevicollis]|uniref:Zn(2)-C6 fungal-type domain-containing protein n=1 Tax=Sordaria brevicollis TaxID=83679 RepID=A0AAE0UBP6_SORBR|nr:hypothetical protein B0T20DRAFT_461003 [Sordaria brevicollis]
MEEGRPRKRVRVSIACHNCRNRKSRCDGQHPSCGRCEELNVSCVYDEPPAAVHHHPRRLNNIDTSPTTAGTKRSRDLTQDDNVDIQDDDGDESNSPRNGLLALPALSGLPSSRSRQEDLNADGMGEVALTDDGENCSTYFGPSSNVALVRQLSLALTRAQSHPSCRSQAMATSAPTLPSSSRYPSHRQLRRPSNDEINDRGVRPQTSRHVPPEPEASNLILQYFSTIGLFFPIIDVDTFTTTYHNLRKGGFMGARRVWLALLYMIIGIVYHYFQWAKELAMPQVLISSSLETVQLLCLMIEYLHGSSQSAQLWTFHSLAVKAALQIGLHSADASRHLTLLEREMRKRTWYQVVMNDNNLAAKFGRPMTILPSLQNKLGPPQDIGDIFPSMYASRSVIATSVDAFKCGVELSHLTCQVVSQLYDDNAGGSNGLNTFNIVRLAFDLSWKLSQWRQSVPPDLRPRNLTSTSTDATAPSLSTSSPSSIEAQRLRAVLSLRYWGLCSLVERPVLLQFLALQHHQLSGPGKAPTSSNQNNVDIKMALNLLRESGVSSLRRCIHACRECIALAKAIVDRWQNHKEELTAVRIALTDAVDLLSRSSESLVISRCHDCLVGFLRAYDSVVTSSSGEQQRDSHSAHVQNNNNFRESSTNTSASASIDNTMPQPQGQGHRQDHVSGVGNGIGMSSSSGYGHVHEHGGVVGSTFSAGLDYFTGTGTSSSLAASLLGDFTGVPLDFGGHWGDPSLPYM